MFTLNYKRKLTDQLGVIMGPNTMGEKFVVSQQSFDFNTQTTTLGLTIYREPANG